MLPIASFSIGKSRSSDRRDLHEFELGLRKLDAVGGRRTAGAAACRRISRLDSLGDAAVELRYATVIDGKIYAGAKAQRRYRDGCAYRDGAPSVDHWTITPRTGCNAALLHAKWLPRKQPASTANNPRRAQQ
jgi:hypothetical protein